MAQVRRGLGKIASIVAIGFAFAAAHAQTSPAPSPIPREVYDRPGQLVVLPDGRKLNLRCSGHGEPTVILESGFGADSSAWGRVQPRIAAVTKVCAYDRAGYGFSDPGPLPRDGAAIARDLDRALNILGVRGPYVVVGHSAGGLYARLFAARRRRQVAGLLFVDPSVPHQPQRIEEVFGPGAGAIDGTRRRPAHCLEVMLAPAIPANEPSRLACAPIGGGTQAHAVGLRPDTWRTQLSELDTLFLASSDQVDRIGQLLKDKPAIVLTAAKTDGEPATADDPAAMNWQMFHHELATAFERGDQRLVRSSHLMMKDRPEIVASAAIELVMAARKPRTRSR